MAHANHSSQANIERIVGLMCQSIEFSHSQHFSDAIACLDAGLRIDPEFIPCRLARARILAALERFEEALADLNHVLRRGQLPDVVATFAALFATALARFDAQLAAAPENTDIYFRRGNLYCQAGNFAAALADYDRALARDNEGVAVHMARGNALVQLHRFPEAARAYAGILDRDRGNAVAWYNRGNALQKDGCLGEAIASYGRAIALVPDFAEARLEQAHCLLAQGDFAEGWRLYEWRWRTPQLAARQLQSTQPRWLGDVPLVGRTILLWAEQGLGDTIQFARFIPRVADVAGKVIVRVPAALHALLSSLDERVTFIEDGEPLPHHDLQCPLMSLPLALGITPDLVPAGRAYLRPDAGRMQAWQARLGNTGRPRIGVCWAGRKAGAGAHNPSRDIPLAALAPLAGLDVQFICLQKELSEADAGMLARLPTLVPLRQGLDSFADTAALIDSLDLVITVDTAIAHLAGALGTPCWLLLRRSGEWRWQQGREDTPWYPSIRIVRQAVEGEWEEVLHGVMGALVQWLATSRSRLG